MNIYVWKKKKKPTAGDHDSSVHKRWVTQSIGILCNIDALVLSIL